MTVVHSSFGNVTTENKEKAFASFGAAIAVEANNKRQAVTFILKLVTGLFDRIGLSVQDAYLLWTPRTLR